MKINKYIIIVICLITINSQAQIMTNSDYQIISDVFDCSAFYSTAHGNDYKLVNSLGQSSPMADSTNNGYKLYSGYLPLYTGDPDNTRPSVENIIIIGTSSDIILKYDLLDPDSPYCEIGIEYKGGAQGCEWKVAALSGNVNDLIPGKNKTIIWKSSIDEAGISADNYQVKIIPSDEGGEGKASLSAIFSVDNKTVLKDTAILKKNRINPVNNEKVKMKFNISKHGKVIMKIYDMRGIIIRTIIDKQLNAGNHEGIWNGKDTEGNNVGSGIYWMHIKTESWNKTEKIMIIK